MVFCRCWVKNIHKQLETETEMEALVTKEPLTVQEVAAQLGVHTNTVRKWYTIGVNDRKLKIKRAGGTGTVRIYQDDLDKFMETKDG